MKNIILLLSGLTISGCASSSGVMPEGRDSFMVFREGGTGFANVNGLKSAAYREAGTYCADLGKKMEVTSTSTRPGGGPGVYPVAEVHFMCLDEQDPQFSRVRMVPDQSPTVIINQGR